MKVWNTEYSEIFGLLVDYISNIEFSDVEQSIFGDN